MGDILIIILIVFVILSMAAREKGVVAVII